MSYKNSWLKKIIEYSETKKPGQCPVCCSSNFKAEIFKYGRTSVLFKCSDCGVAKHFDGGIKDKTASM